jgi:hypothetical protein
MRGESEVRLVREFVRIRLSPRLARTTVQFEFRNEGLPRTVVMGFPEQVIYGRGHYRRFRAKVEGRALAASPTRWVEESPQTLWGRWWVSKVRFARAGRRIVRVRYQEHPAVDELEVLYRYLFGTGRSWKGTIGSVEVLMMLERFPAEATVWADLLGPTRKADRLAWRFENWEPDEDADLGVAVSPHITHVEFDGEAPDPPMELALRRGRLEAYLYDLAFWMKAGLAWSPRERTALIYRKGKTLELTVGSDEALLSPERTRVRLPFAPYLAGRPLKEGRHLRVPVRAVCEALALRVHTEKDAMGNWKVRISASGK